MAEQNRIADTRTVLQIEATECGAACLSMILQYFGQYVPLEQLRAETDVSRDGSSAKNIVRAALHRDLDCEGYELDIDGLSELSPPCILWWQRNHFVVYEGMKGGSFYINDPAYGKRRVDMQTMKRDFSEVALSFSPGEGFTDHPEYGARPDGFFHSGRISRLLRSHGTAAAFAAFSGLFATIAGLAAAALPDLLPPKPPDQRQHGQTEQVPQRVDANLLRRAAGNQHEHDAAQKRVDTAPGPPPDEDDCRNGRHRRDAPGLTRKPDVRGVDDQRLEHDQDEGEERQVDGAVAFKGLVPVQLQSSPSACAPKRS